MGTDSATGLDTATVLFVRVVSCTRGLAVGHETQSPFLSALAYGTASASAAKVGQSLCATLITLCNTRLVNLAKTHHVVAMFALAGVIGPYEACCGSPTAVLDRDGECCFGSLDACGVCNGTAIAVDVRGPLLFDS